MHTVCSPLAVPTHHLFFLFQVLWLKSRSSEIWLDRRTNYTRSLAVMSMVKTSFTQEGFFCFRKSPCRELENISSFSCFCGSKHVSFSIWSQAIDGAIADYRRHLMMIVTTCLHDPCELFLFQILTLFDSKVLKIAIVPDLNDSCGQVGYLLGLGDRHPSNLMLDRQRLVYTCTSFNLF